MLDRVIPEWFREGRRKGGLAKSEKKRLAAIANGKRGGRPKKVKPPKTVSDLTTELS